MNRVLFTSAFALTIASPAFAADTPPKSVDPSVPATLAAYKHLAVDGGEYKLAFNDEFVGDTLDTKKWKPLLPWAGDEDHHFHIDQYASWISEEDVHISGGQLHLTTRKVDTKGKKRTYHYTEGMITTNGKFEFKYGYCEARCRAPADAGRGLWPAFWTLSAGWPPEFDIVEFWTSEPRIHQGYAFKRGDNGQVGWDSFHAHEMPRGWHTYGMEWGPGYVFFNIDGNVNKKVFGWDVTSQPEYILLNSGVAAKSSPPPDAKTVFPNSFDVDWCRVYQRESPTAVLHNPSFENANIEPWDGGKNVTLINDKTHTGKQAIRLNGNASSEQKIYGLKPATKYLLTGWAASAKAGEESRIGVKNFGGQETYKPVTSTAYEMAEVPFTTGPEARDAMLYCWKPDGGAGFFDDFTLTEVAK